MKHYAMKAYGEWMYIYIYFLRMTDTMTSQNIDLSSWDTLYSLAADGVAKQSTNKKRNTSEQKIKQEVNIRNCQVFSIQ
jgi:hypothetical protein